MQQHECVHMHTYAHLQYSTYHTFAHVHSTCAVCTRKFTCIVYMCRVYMCVICICMYALKCVGGSCIAHALQVSAAQQQRHLQTCHHRHRCDPSRTKKQDRGGRLSGASMLYFVVLLCAQLIDGQPYVIRSAIDQCLLQAVHPTCLAQVSSVE